MQVALVFSHTVPTFLLLYNFYFTESSIRLEDWWQSLLLVLIYLGVNLWFTKKEGAPVYPFMSWDDPLTLLYSVGCWAVGQLCSCATEIIQRWITKNYPIN